MIGKLIRGRSMRGLLDYLLAATDQKDGTRPRVSIVGATFAGTTAREIAREFAALRALRPNLGVAVVHETLRLPPNAVEPTDAEWRAIARHWTKAMGFGAWVAVAHGDGHIHIAASRILVDGSVISDKHDWTLSERVVRDIERIFGLEAVEPSHLLNHDNDWIKQKTPTQAQSAVADQSGLPLPSEILAAVIDGLLSEALSATDFVRGLEAAGIDVRANIASTGKVSGLAYALGGVTVTAKALGRAYTWSHLQRRGLGFDAVRDLPMLRAAGERSVLKEEAARQSFDGDFGDDRPADDGPPILRTAEAFTSVAIANFVEAAGTDQFRVFLEPRSPAGIGFTAISALMQPAVLRHMLDGARFGSAIRAELLDPRIVVITELAQEQVSALDKHGLQPFAVSEIRPDVFEACIRLAPANEPAPSLKVQKKAAAIAAKLIGGEVGDAISLPGFNSQTLRIRKKRRVVVMLRKAASVVAERGGLLLASAQRQLEKIAARLKVIQPSADLPTAGSVADSQLTAQEGAPPPVVLLDRMTPSRGALNPAIIPDEAFNEDWSPF